MGIFFTLISLSFVVNDYNINVIFCLKLIQYYGYWVSTGDTDYTGYVDFIAVSYIKCKGIWFYQFNILRDTVGKQPSIQKCFGLLFTPFMYHRVLFRVHISSGRTRSWFFIPHNLFNHHNLLSIYFAIHLVRLSNIFVKLLLYCKGQVLFLMLRDQIKSKLCSNSIHCINPSATLVEFLVNLSDYYNCLYPDSLSRQDIGSHDSDNISYLQAVFILEGRQLPTAIRYWRIIQNPNAHLCLVTKN